MISGVLLRLLAAKVILIGAWVGTRVLFIEIRAPFTVIRALFIGARAPFTVIRVPFVRARVPFVRTRALLNSIDAMMVGL